MKFELTEHARQDWDRVVEASPQLSAYIAARMADAWDEGYSEGDADQIVGGWPRTRNPYRDGAQ